MRRLAVSAVVAATALLALAQISRAGFITKHDAWTPEQMATISSLSLDALPPLPPDPSNLVGDNPRAARLGEALFNDKGLSGNGQVACATCHLEEKEFQDGTPLGHGMGITNRRTMPIAGTAYQPFLFWDGRKDSQWSQALGPLESPVEHGTDRTAVAHRIAAVYRTEYEALFGSLPDLSTLPAHASPAGSAELQDAWNRLSPPRQALVNRLFANTGKAIAAFERRILPKPSPFDRYARALASGETTEEILGEQQVRGLALFIGKANCSTCHNGPMFSDGHFHNTGVPAADGLPEDLGRKTGAVKVLADAFNCLGPYSDAKPEDCSELNFMAEAGDDQIRAFKPPSLRNIARRPPYMHAGQFANLDAVLDHYNRAPAAIAGRSELQKLDLTKAELEDLKSFLVALNSE